MKKLIALMLTLIMVMSLVACGNNDTPKQTSGGNETTGTNEQTTTESKELEDSTPPVAQTDGMTETTPGQSNLNTLQVPSKEIYFSCPSGWEVEEETKTLILMKSEEALVGVFYDWQNTAAGELIEMVSNYSAKFLRDISSYSKGYLRTSSIEVLSSGNGKIGEFECATFTGKANNDGEWDCHVYGYTSVIDGVNVMVIGLVSAKAQDASMIAEIDAMTDQVANSVRTHK